MGNQKPILKLDVSLSLGGQYDEGYGQYANEVCGLHVYVYHHDHGSYVHQTYLHDSYHDGHHPYEVSCLH